MNLKVARQILSGELVFSHFAIFSPDGAIFVDRKTKKNVRVAFGKIGTQFMLRQLASKVVKEREKTPTTHPVKRP